jgi:type IV fimbrial biogenesis protein FimT
MVQQSTTYPAAMCRGTTLVELLVVVAIMGIVAALGFPSFSDARERQKLNGLADNLHFFMKLARAEAAKKNNDVFVVLNETLGGAWCIGLSDTNGVCNCETANACAVDGIERVIRSTEYQSVRYASTFVNDVITIEPYRGRSADAGSLTFTLHSGIKQKDIRIIRSVMGRDRVCSPSNTSMRYPQC